jgi:hypothetical protein
MVPSRKMISALSSIDRTKKLRNTRSLEINLISPHFIIFPLFLKFYSRKSLKKIDDVYCQPTLCQRSLGECRDCGLRKQFCTRAGFCVLSECCMMLMLLKGRHKRESQNAGDQRRTRVWNLQYFCKIYTKKTVLCKPKYFFYKTNVNQSTLVYI